MCCFLVGGKMKNLKFIAVFSCFGFLLSFFSGLASRGNNIGRMIFHAVIFAIVFAGLAVLINMIFCRFVEKETAILFLHPVVMLLI